METPVSFGLWIRQRRKALDLTQETLAERVNCSASAIRKLEADERRPSREVAELLATALAIEPQDRPTFLKVARQEWRIERLAAVAPLNVQPALIPATPVAAAMPVPLAAKLPIPATPLVGRTVELAQLLRFLAEPNCRLLSLVGPGGMGKTRLALAAAVEASALYPDGVYFVALAPLTSAAFIASAIANIIGLVLTGATEPQLELAHYLHEKQMLLVLDNLEHLLPTAFEPADVDAEAAAVELLIALLQAAPQVKFLITSRERLNLQGEWVFDLQGLPVPSTPSTFIPVLAQHPIEVPAYTGGDGAVELFVHSARRVQADFALSAQNYADVVHICQLVEGLPLGIELAAAWTYMLSCREIVQEIERNIDFLTFNKRDLPVRHRSVRAVFEHSWRLLSVDEQQGLSELAVFRGGFRRAAAEQVAGVSLHLLSSLINKSLLRRAEVERYELHELVRQFALEQLNTAGAVAATNQRHFRYFLELAESAEPQLLYKADLADQLQQEDHNLRAALTWALAQPPLGAGARLAGALWRYWYIHGYLREGRQWLARALAALPLPVDSTQRTVQAKALLGAGALAWGQGDYAEAQRQLMQSLALYREIGDKAGIANALNFLGNIAGGQGDYAQAQQYHQESLLLRQAVGDQWGIAASLNNLGMMARNLGELAQAQQSFEASLTQRRLLGDQRGMTNVLNNLGLLFCAQGDWAQGQVLLEEGLAISQALGDRWNTAYLTGNLAGIILQQGDGARATELFCTSLRLSHELGDQAEFAACLQGLAKAAQAQGHLGRAVKLLSAAAALRARIGETLSPTSQATFEHAFATLKVTVEETTFSLCWASGAAMTLEQAVAYALAPPD